MQRRLYYRVHSVFLKMYFLYVILKLLELIRKTEILKGAFTYESGNTGTLKTTTQIQGNTDPDLSGSQTDPAKQGYEQLSIKNICEEAGVSNGSFYHHFKTKDDLLSYYIEEQPSMDPNLLDLPSSAAGTKRGNHLGLLELCHYCEELGVEFMANYYTPKNQSLNPLIRTERPYPIITVHDYLKRVIDAGIISPPADLEDITTDIRMIVIGNVFEWCLKSGDADFEGNMRRSLTTYLNGLF
mgnify:CR=1 FL=1